MEGRGLWYEGGMSYLVLLRKVPSFNIHDERGNARYDIVRLHNPGSTTIPSNGEYTFGREALDLTKSKAYEKIFGNRNSILLSH